MHDPDTNLLSSPLSILPQAYREQTFLNVEPQQ
jgi:hypothetical protein